MLHLTTRATEKRRVSSASPPAVDAEALGGSGDRRSSSAARRWTTTRSCAMALPKAARAWAWASVDPLLDQHEARARPDGGAPLGPSRRTRCAGARTRAGCSPLCSSCEPDELQPDALSPSPSVSARPRPRPSSFTHGQRPRLMRPAAPISCARPAAPGPLRRCADSFCNLLDSVVPCGIHPGGASMRTCLAQSFSGSHTAVKSSSSRRSSGP